MILEEETYEKFGYYSRDLKPKSHRYILITCDDCGKIREIQKASYHPLCKSCVKKGIRHPLFGKHHSAETKRKQSKTQRKLTNAQRKLNHAMAFGIWHALHGAKHCRRWETLVGYTLAELMQTLEKEFRDGMSWENYGKWHIDHIIPLAKFKFESYDNSEFKKAWALGNLQPLWADENIRKRDKFMFF